MKDSIYINTIGPPNIPKENKLHLKLKTEKIESKINNTNNDLRLVTIEVSGPTRMNIIISDNNYGKRIIKWNLTGKKHDSTTTKTNDDDIYTTPYPTRRDDGTHYIQLIHGSCDNDICHRTISLLIKGKQIIKVAVYGHYIDLAGETIVHQFIERLPDWSKGAEWTNFPSELIYDEI